jgi:NAD/NADP transhydrogenase beta subunit
MTMMPQMVGLLNSFGGLAAALAAVSLFLSDTAEMGLTEGESRLQVCACVCVCVCGCV